MDHASEDDEPSYELVAVNQLPVVDVNKSMKRALLSEDGVKAYKRISKKIKLTSILFYFIAFPIGAAVLTVDTKYARFLSLFKFSFQVPLLITVTAGLRVDIIRCLAVTYEFWFFTVINALACVMFAINFSDMRIFMAPVYWYGIQLCVCADAKIQDPHVTSASALAAIYHIFLLVVFGMKLTPDAHIIQVFSNNGHGMTSTDFLMNSFPTIMLLLARTSYRKRGFQKKHGLDPLAIRLASFRCRVKLSEKKSDQSTAGSTLEVDHRRRSDPGSSLYLTAGAPGEVQSVLQRLHLIKSTQEFKGYGIVVLNMLHFVQSHPRVPSFVGVLGCFGFTLNVAAFVCSYYWSKTKIRSGTFWTLSVLGFLFSLSFCGAFVGLYQRQLLRRLTTSFDFIFITLQNTLAYLSICDMMYWDPRCLTILTGWIWLMWLLTLDCLTPKVRAVTGFHTKFAIPVLLFAIFVQGLITEQILFAHSVDLQDRIFWHPRLMGFSMEIRVVPFFLGRVVTLLLWSFRVLWRLCSSGEDDLIMIQGTVEFFGNPKALQKENNSTTSLSSSDKALRGPSLLMLQSGLSLLALQRGSSRIVPSESDSDAVKPMEINQNYRTVPPIGAEPSDPTASVDQRRKRSDPDSGQRRVRRESGCALNAQQKSERVVSKIFEYKVIEPSFVELHLSVEPHSHTVAVDPMATLANEHPIAPQASHQTALPSSSGATWAPCTMHFSFATAYLKSQNAKLSATCAISPEDVKDAVPTIKKQQSRASKFSFCHKRDSGKKAVDSNAKTERKKQAWWRQSVLSQSFIHWC